MASQTLKAADRSIGPGRGVGAFNDACGFVVLFAHALTGAVANCYFRSHVSMYDDHH
jgi:hypothetical protein